MLVDLIAQLIEPYHTLSLKCCPEQTTGNVFFLINYNLFVKELLGQGLQLSLANSFTEKTKLISYELVECFSQFDTGSCSQYLSLYQVRTIITL